MNAFEAIEKEQAIIEAENQRIMREEGFSSMPELTGKIFVDGVQKVIWHEQRDHGYLTWVSLGYPDRAAHGELAVGVDDIDEALDYPNWVNE